MAGSADYVGAFRKAADHCPIPAVIAVIGERWTFLILRGALLGLRHFEEFQACLGIARNILSDRLGRLVAADILARTPDPCDRRRVIYALTERGQGLLPVLVALRQWGIDSGLGDAQSPTLVDRSDHRPVARLRVLAHDGRALEPHDLVWLDEHGEEMPLPSPAEVDEAA